MKSLRLLPLVMTLCLALGPKPSIAAPDEYDDSQSNPFRSGRFLDPSIFSSAALSPLRPFLAIGPILPSSPNLGPTHIMEYRLGSH